MQSPDGPAPMMGRSAYGGDAVQVNRAGSSIKPYRAWGTVRPENRNEGFPADWRDPLELYGILRRELARPLLDPSIERVQAGEWVRRHGAQWVWCNRHRLVSLRKFIARDAGSRRRPQPTRSRGGGVCHGSSL
jgi:hypothetical protein